MKYSYKIKNDFKLSWVEIKTFFEKTSNKHDHLKPILKLINKFENKKLHFQLRAGQSLFFLVLTRSRLHSRDYKKSLKISINNEGEFEIFKYNSNISTEKIDWIEVKDPFESQKFNLWIEELLNETIK